MKDVLKYGLLAAGAWLLWRQLAAPATAQTLTYQDPNQTPYTPPASTPTPPPAPQPQQQAPANQPTGSSPALPPVAALMLAAAGNHNYQNIDVWNYYYHEITGRPGPKPEDIGITRQGTMPGMTIQDWIAATAGTVQLGA